jgi:hypothetical protein
MRRRVWIGFFLAVLASISVLWFFSSYMMPPSETGFRIYSIENNALLISDADILSYNWTSQEMAITTEASERLTETGNLYSWPGGVCGQNRRRGNLPRHIQRIYNVSNTNSSKNLYTVPFCEFPI